MGVLGHLLSEMESDQEDLATEALHYILEESDTAHAALVDYLNNLSGSQLPSTMRFRTQTGAEDGGIPDMVGEAGGDAILLVEAKFGANLTDHQPETYLDSLPARETAACLFIAPRKRVDRLWQKLLRHCQNHADLVVSSSTAEHEEFKAVRIGDEHQLMLTSWPKILGAIRDRLHSNNEADLLQDVDQLADLCRRIDAEAFLPLQRQELDGRHGQRILHYRDLLRDLFGRIKAEEFVSEREGRPKRVYRSQWYYRIQIGDYPARLMVSYRAWSNHADTPFWLAIQGNEADETAHLKELLDGADEDPIEYFDYEHGYLAVPLFPATQRERSEVLDSLHRDLRGICDRVRG